MDIYVVSRKTGSDFPLEVSEQETVGSLRSRIAALVVPDGDAGCVTLEIGVGMADTLPDTTPLSTLPLPLCTIVFDVHSAKPKPGRYMTGSTNSTAICREKGILAAGLVCEPQERSCVTLWTTRDAARLVHVETLSDMDTSSSSSVRSAASKNVSLRGHRGTVCVAFSSCGAFLFTGDNAGRLRRYRTESWVEGGECGAETKPERKLAAHGSAVTSVSCCGAFVVTTSYDKTARIWDKTTLRCVSRIDSDCYIFSQCFSHDGTTLTLGLADGTIQIYSTQTWARLSSFSILPSPGAVSAVALSPDGRYIAAGGDDCLTLYSISGVEQWVAYGEQVGKGGSGGDGGPVRAVSFNAEGTVLVHGGGRYAGYVRDVASGVVLQTFPVKSCVWSAQWSQCGTRVYLAGDGVEVVEVEV